MESLKRSLLMYARVSCDDFQTSIVLHGRKRENICHARYIV
jgi:hypothetical protein